MTFRSELLKSSASALLGATLLGVVIYLVSIQIGPEAPRPIATLDSYTGRGGFGPVVASNFYFYNQNITIFANVKDESNNPIADATVKFEIRGPPNSDIILVETAKTNSSGVAVANITAPCNLGSPEKVLGIWSVVSTTEITRSNITDSLAFEVKPPPTPFVDVYTDRGGKGTNMPSQAYNLNETVHLYAEASNGTAPAVNRQVAFAVYAPRNSSTNQTVTFLQVSSSNESGVAAIFFRFPPVPEISVGTWRVIATVNVNEQVFIDALTFECTA